MALPKDKKLLTVAMPTWKMRAIKMLKQKRAVNISQLIENYLTEYFGEELEEFRPKKGTLKNANETVSV